MYALVKLPDDGISRGKSPTFFYSFAKLLHTSLNTENETNFIPENVDVRRQLGPTLIKVIGH